MNQHRMGPTAVSWNIADLLKWKKEENYKMNSRETMPCFLMVTMTTDDDDDDDDSDGDDDGDGDDDDGDE